MESIISMMENGPPFSGAEAGPVGGGPFPILDRSRLNGTPGRRQENVDAVY